MEQLSSSLCRQLTELCPPCWRPRNMPNAFLLVGSNPDSSWAATVREGLKSLGRLDVSAAFEAAGRLREADYRMVIIDAGAVEDVVSLIGSLRGESPEVPIVVATASPTWQSAKEVFMKGANDYIRKSPDASALGVTLAEILSRPR